jgi:adenine deaminase
MNIMRLKIATRRLILQNTLSDTLIPAALNQVEIDTCIVNAQVANVITGEIYPADIAIHNGYIVAVEPPNTQPPRRAKKTIDAAGYIATPGLIDAHLHIESTLATPNTFAQAVLPLGTTTICEDPHEVANVLGTRGIIAMMNDSANVPLKIEYLISSSVPSARGLETAGGSITPDDVGELINMPHVLGLAEVMDGAGLLMGDANVTGVLRAGGGLHGYRAFYSPVIEGHNPMLRGRELCAFVAAGVDSDHTQATVDDLIEKARQGVTLMLQERYINEGVIAALEKLPHDIGVCIITDDVAPEYLLSHGHLDHVMRRCIALGMSPLRALRACTLNPARRMRLWDRGCIAPGRAADIVLTRSIESFRAETVWVNGIIVAQEGRCLWQPHPDEALNAYRNTVKLPKQTAHDFVVRADIDAGELDVRVIEAVPTTSTREGRARVCVRDGAIQLEGHADLAFICVADRHAVHGGRAFGLLRNIGITRGALASSLAHDSHNLCVIGRDAESMARAANAVIQTQGGFAVCDGDQITLIPLPIAGILSSLPVNESAAQLTAVERALHAIGVIHPFWLMRLSTFTLPVSSGLRITDLGLVDARARQIVPLVL